MNGHGDECIRWMQQTDDDRDESDAAEIMRQMTDAERQEFEAWLDSLPGLRTTSEQKPDGGADQGSNT